jgi:hypothetical protein
MDLFICILCFIGLLMFFFAGLELSYEYNKKNLTICLLGLIILILSIFAIIAINNKFDAMHYETKLESTEYIKSLEDNFNTSGRMYGKYYSKNYFNEDLYYSYMVILSDGGSILNKIPAGQTMVYETNDNFRVEWYIKTKSWLGLTSTIKSWKIYIPKNSMTENFNIDLK